MMEMYVCRISGVLQPGCSRRVCSAREKLFVSCFRRAAVVMVARRSSSAGRDAGQARTMSNSSWIRRAARRPRARDWYVLRSASDTGNGPWGLAEMQASTSKLNRAKWFSTQSFRDTMQGDATDSEAPRDTVSIVAEKERVSGADQRPAYAPMTKSDIIASMTSANKA
jgi:hypothetical protein